MRAVRGGLRLCFGPISNGLCRLKIRYGFWARRVASSELSRMASVGKPRALRAGNVASHIEDLDERFSSWAESSTAAAVSPSSMESALHKGSLFRSKSSPKQGTWTNNPDPTDAGATGARTSPASLHGCVVGSTAGRFGGESADALPPPVGEVSSGSGFAPVDCSAPIRTADRPRPAPVQSACTNLYVLALYRTHSRIVAVRNE